VSIQIVMMLPPRAASVSLARHTLAEALGVPGVAPECIHEAQVALSEACNNILRHVEAGASFEVLINVGDAELTVHILETNAGISHARQLANWPDVHAEGDGSMTLMTEFADQASFESEGGRGSVRLKKRLRWNDSEESVASSG
jgi:serine/threonine-protein kinase RsbW